MKRAIIALSAAVTLAGCGSNEGYPSLARRPAERYAEAAPPPAMPEVKATETLDPATAARIATLGEQARAAHAEFLSAKPAASASVGAAANAAPGSDAWSKASIALATLELKRSPATIALAEIDQIYVRMRVDGGEGSSLAAVRDQITAWVADEDAVLADLKGRLPE